MKKSQQKKNKPITDEILNSTALDPNFWLLATLSFFVPFIVYILTLCPTVAGGDSGELIATAYFSGVAHPPGYPLYILLAKIFALLPFGELAWKINLMSAFFNSLASTVLALIVCRFTQKWWLGFFAALVFAFAPVVWRYSLIAEVFALNNLLVALMLLLFLFYLQKPDAKYLAWGCLLSGLALSHHHTFFILFFPVVLFILIDAVTKKLFNINILLKSVGYFVLGCLPLAYMPWSAQMARQVTWGDLASWDGFWTHLLRREYGTFNLAWGSTESSLLQGLQFFTQCLFENFWLLPLACLGIIPLWPKFAKWQKTFLIGITAAGIFYLTVFHTLANLPLNQPLYYEVQTRFWIVVFLLFIIGISIGADSIILRLNMNKYKMFAPALLITIGCSQMLWHYKTEDQSQNWLFYNHAKVTLENLPTKSLLITRGDAFINSIRYLHDVQGLRPDIVAFPIDLYRYHWMKPIGDKIYPSVIIPGQVYGYSKTTLPGHFSFTEFIAANEQFAHIYIGNLIDQETKENNGRYTFWPQAFARLVVNPQKSFNVTEYIEQSFASISQFPIPEIPVRHRSWEGFVMFNFWQNQKERLTMLTDNMDKMPNNKLIMLKGMIQGGEFLNAHQPTPMLARNLGVSYWQLLNLTGANEELEKKLLRTWQDYLARAPASDDQLATIRQQVMALEKKHEKIKSH